MHFDNLRLWQHAHTFGQERARRAHAKEAHKKELTPELKKKAKAAIKTVAKAGKYTLTIKPKKIEGGGLMDLRHLTLRHGSGLRLLFITPEKVLIGGRGGVVDGTDGAACVDWIE